MNRWTVSLCAALASCTLMAAPAAAQQPQSQAPAPSQAPASADCMAGTPQKMEGQVVRVDPNGGRVTVRDSRGQTHEFQAARETLATMKPGDRVDATLRQAPKC